MQEQTTNKKFALVACAGRIGPTELAKLIGRHTEHTPSTQTIRNHADAGKISGKKTASGWQFEPDQALADWKANVTKPAHGGRRRGAGKKKHDTPAPLTGAISDHRHAKAEIKVQLTADEDGKMPPHPDGAMRLIDALRCTHDQLLALVAFGGVSEDLLGNAHVDRLKQLLDLQRSQLALAKDKQALVPAEQIAEAWGQAAGQVANALESAPKRTAARIAAACWPGDSLRQTVARTLKASDVESTVISAVLGILAQPPDLVGRVRMMLKKEIDEAMQAIASGTEPDTGG